MNINDHKAQRYSLQDIRSTWGDMAIKQDVKIIFHLGVDTSITIKQQEKLDREIQDNQDILQQNFIDNYQNLTSIKYYLDIIDYQ